MFNKHFRFIAYIILEERSTSPFSNTISPNRPIATTQPGLKTQKSIGQPIRPAMEDSIFCQELGLSEDFDPSINLDHLKDAAMNSQLDFTEESGVNLMANHQSVSPFRTRTMKEYDQQISELKKENFNLKLRIYFLEEKMHQKCTTYDRDEAINKMNIELKVELESVKKELADKKDLVLKAHQALEALEAQRKIDLDQQANGTQPIRLPSTVITGNSKENESQGCHVAELQSLVEDSNYKIDTFQRKIKALESTIQAKDNYIKLQEENQLKKSKAIQGLLKAVQAKNKECNELAKKLEYQSYDNKQHKEMVANNAVLPEGHHILTSCANIETKQKVTYSDNQEQCKVKSYLEDSPKKNECISGPRTSPQIMGEKEQTGKCDSPLTDELAIDFKLGLEKKDEEIRQLQIKYDELREKLGELQKIESDLKRIQHLNMVLESKLEGSRKEQRCIEEQLVQSQEEVSSIKLKFGKCIDSIQLLSKYLDRISLEDVDFVDTKISIEDEMVAVLGKKLLKQYEIMREIISINSVVDEHANDAGESVDGSGLMGDSALKKLHHLDLIRDSYEKVNSFSLTSSVGSMKNGIALQTKLYTCLKEKQFIEELLISTLRELKFIRSLTDCKLDDSLCNADRSDEIYKCLQNVEMEQLSDELKKELSMLKTQVGMMHKLHSLLLQQLKFKCSFTPLDSEDHDRLEKLLHETKFIFEEMKLIQSKPMVNNADDPAMANQEDESEQKKAIISDEVSPSLVHSPSFMQEDSERSREELSRLRFLLTSTEGTVHLLGSKVKHYRQMLIDSGVWPAICAGLHQSDFSVTRPEFHSSGFSALGYLNSRHNFGKADNTVNLKFLHALEAKCQDCPAKCTAFHDDTSNNEIKVDEVDVPTTATVNNLQTCQQFSEAIPISGTLKRVQNASCQTSRLVDCNEISYSFGEPLGDSIDVVRNLIKSKRISSVLTKHLEEVAEFLRGLLHFGENGSLDLTYLTSEKLSFVNDHLKATWDLSNSLKHCLNELDRSTTLVEANSVCSNVLQSEGRNNKTNSDICISPQNDSIIVGDRTLNYRFPDKTPNSELALVDDFSTQMQNMNDNYILVLKPKVSNGLWLNYDEELPTCSLTFDHQGSFLTSTNVGHHIDETQCKNNGDHNTSDSDTWSAPDIGVSQQRIGLENTQLFSPQSNKRFWLSPRKRDSGVTDSSSSSVAPVSAKVADKKHNIQEGSIVEQQKLVISVIQKEKSLLLAQVQELTEKFESYQATIESLQLMVEEHQKASKNAVIQAELLKADLVDKEQKLQESEVIKEQLHKALNDIKMELEENISSVQHLQEVNREMKINFDKQKEDMIKNEKETKLQVDLELEDLRSEIKNLRFQLQDSITLNQALMVKSKQSDHGCESAPLVTKTSRLGSSLADSCDSSSSSTTLSHFHYINSNNVNDGNTDVYLESVSDNIVGPSSSLPLPVARHHQSEHTFNSSFQSSPDLGIESDRSRVSSLERNGQTCDNLTLLKRSIVESLNIIRAVRRIAKEHLIAVKRNRVVLTDNRLYVDWKDVYSSCCSIKNYLLESCSLADQMWIRPSQLEVEKNNTKYYNTVITDNKNFLLLEQDELLHLYHKLAAEKQKADDAVTKLEHANQLKRGMEKAIVRQLRKTHNVLLKAKGNLEHHQTKCVPSNHKQQAISCVGYEDPSR